jgi:hypothetical protein
MLKRIFGPKREELVRDWRRLLNEELHKLYASPNIFLKGTYSPSWTFGLL